MIYLPDSTKLNGILQRRKRLFTVFASDFLKGYEPEKALNQENSYFHSNYTAANHWFCVKFKSYFEIKSYTIKTRYTDPYHPKIWKVHGSNDFADWHIVDEKSTNILQYNNQVENFVVDKPGIYKYIKITQIENIGGTSTFFTFGSLDLFGTYIVPCIFERRAFSAKANLAASIVLVLLF